eukprot:10304_1
MLAGSMAYKVFGNKHQCDVSQLQPQDPQFVLHPLKCQAMNRIKIILHLVNEHEDESNFMDELTSIFTPNHYTNTSLLNDFHHIKYTHHVDDDDAVFAKTYEYFVGGIGTVCDGRQCRFMSRHYRDRPTLQSDYTLNDETQDNDEYNPYDSRYMIDLISRVHVYFIHSYHINRFTLNEVRRVNE